jgi:hypothetical protein
MSKIHCKGDIHCFERKETCDCGKKSCKPQELEDWEKEFDRIYGDSPFSPTTMASDNFLIKKDDIKQFIRNLLVQKEKEWCLKKPNIEVSAVAGFEAGFESRNEEIKAWIKNHNIRCDTDYAEDVEAVDLCDLLEFLNKN